MVRELVTGAPNQYEGTIRARPKSWSAEKWKEAYGFNVGGEEFASRMDKFIGRKFRNATNPKDGFAIADCEDSRAKRVLEFFIPIFYPEKPTLVTVTIGNTIFGALLGEQKVDWKVVLQAIVAKLVEGARKLKATPIGPYMFHLYMGQEALSGKEMVAYDIRLNLLKNDSTSEPDSDQDQGSPTRSDPEPSPSVRRNRQKKSDRPGSAQSRGNRSEALELTQQEIKEMSHSFDNAIRWMELAKIHYDQLGDVVVNVCKALGNIEIRDIDEALSQVARKPEVADWDAQISQLTWEKEELQTRLLKRNCFFRGSAVPLEKVLDLSEFPDLPPTKVLQNIQTPTTLGTNQELVKSEERQALGSDARTNEVERAQSEEVPTGCPRPDNSLRDSNLSFDNYL